ncbi:D-alanyl-D-alanine carboxypeptidase/D-alanyl-D-alanine endopeptidase [Demequina sp.]|uniref:D-alanyl-D-alanine carboxypeptidase/D-alanyl-D-alanine endopeptidase n=1 Tax=Demequina sp. TaxID=2050685 RepID=UPI003D0C38A3
MRGKVVAAVLVPSLIVAGATGYAWADATDRVPGILTSAPLPSPQPPLLTASPLAVASPSPGPVGAFSSSAPLPSPDAVAALAAQLRSDDRTGKSTNVYVADYTTGSVLADLDGDNPQVPASTTKLLTAVAALEALGPDYTFDTTVVFDGATSTLTLVAGGDLMLAAGHGHYGSKVYDSGEPQANGWAGVADLADQIADTVPVGPVTIAVDTSDFPGPAYPASWPEYPFYMGYAGKVEGIAVNVGKKNGIPASEYGARDKEPALRTLKALGTALTKLGYEVTNEGKATAASGSTEVARVESAPMSAVTTEFLRYSDNTVAEQTARVLALEAGLDATPANAATVTASTLAGMGVDVRGLKLYDGAGFSDRNQVSPATLVSALVQARTAGNTAGLLTYLPLGGLEGTVAVRFEGAPAAGFLRAKTGSLTGVTALAGVVVTADGRQLAFATLLDGMPAGQKRPIAAVDEFVNALAECGCAG